MGEGESSRRVERRGNLVVRGDGTEVLSVEVIQLANEEVNVVRGQSVILLQIIEGNKRESSREIPPKDMNGRAGVLGRMNDMYYWEVEGEGWGDVDLHYNQRIMVYLRTPLKAMKRTDEKRRGGETSI